MATKVNKVKRKVAPKGSTYRVEIGGEDLTRKNIDEYLGDESVELYEGSRRILHFDSSNHEFCCGMVEIGEFGLAKTLKDADAKEIVKLLQDLVAGVTDGNRARTITATTSAIQVKMASFLKASGVFEDVKVFPNISSNNQVTLWVSNN